MLSCLQDGASKRSLAAKEKSSPCSGGSKFPLSLSVWYSLTVNKILSASLIKTFSSLLHNNST